MASPIRRAYVLAAPVPSAACLYAMLPHLTSQRSKSLFRRIADLKPVRNTNTMSSQSGKPSHDIRSEVTMKRRKVRKGTFSCWECKRRKMKCMPDSLTVFPCKSCQRRGSYCVSQEFPEETWSPEHANVHYTLLQHASLRDSARTSPNSGLSSTSSSHSIAQEIRNNGCQGRASTIISGVRSVSDHDIATPTSMISEPSGNLLFYKSSIVSFPTKHPSLLLTIFVSIAT
jgi:hypothetical protein